MQEFHLCQSKPLQWFAAALFRVVGADAEIAEETDRIVQRDASDATQTVQAKDAVLIDTTYLTQPEQVDRIVALAKAVTQRPDATSRVDD